VLFYTTSVILGA